MRVQRCPLPQTHTIHLELPRGARPLHFSSYRGDPCLWVQVDDGEKRMERRTFNIVGPCALDPGEPVYIGSISEGAAVWHLFEIKEIGRKATKARPRPARPARSAARAHEP